MKILVPFLEKKTCFSDVCWEHRQGNSHPRSVSWQAFPSTPPFATITPQITSEHRSSDGKELV